MCVCCHEIFSKIFTQQPLWMSKITSELEFDPPVLAPVAPLSPSHSAASFFRTNVFILHKLLLWPFFQLATHDGQSSSIRLRCGCKTRAVLFDLQDSVSS